jgi:cilia- and flagella-associated protein 52
MHKVRVHALAFSPDNKYLVSLGGVDDNGLILWDVENGKAISGAVASKDTSGATQCLTFCRKNALRFATGGEKVLRIWDINPDTLKMLPTDCQLGNMKRNFLCLSCDFKDEMLYCGTTTGDVLQINLNTSLLVKSGPVKVKDYLGGGVTSVRPFAAKHLVFAGSGSGAVANLDINTMAIKQ